MQKTTKVFVLFALVFLLLLTLVQTTWAASTGKIAGQIVDQETNEPLPGVNVVIQGTSLGAATDTDGSYFIINIPPGNYQVRASIIGYATVLKENVQVSINQTTNVDFNMVQESIQGETVVVEGERPVIRHDVSSSQNIVTSESIESRPVDNLEEVLSAEAGIQLSAGTEGTGLVVRGGGLNETDIVIDGLSTRNKRTQQPMTTINLSAVQEIEILTGGFNAEYGDIRSGMVNVVTKEGSMDRYSLSLNARTSPPARKHFGPSPFGINGPFWQVYAGQDAFGGVSQEMVDNGEYPFTFVGWNQVSRQYLADADPNNDMTPQALLELWKWQHRNREYANEPDYIVDGALSGPIPGTPVAFMLSERYENLQLVYPFSRNNSMSSTTLLKLTTHLSPQMKLSFMNNFMLQRGVSGSIYDDTNGLITGTRQGTEYGRDAFYWRYIWHDASYNPAEIRQYSGGLSLNHVLSTRTFYDVNLEYTNYQITQEPIGLRDTTGIKNIAGRWYDEQPFGYVGSQIGSITEKYGVLGDFLMSGGGRGQDHSRYWGIQLTGDLVSQINKHNQVKTGITVDYTEFRERREINHGATTQPFDENPTNWWYYNSSPVKLGAYIQDKLEYEGMIANIGIRADYLQPGINPYNLNPSYIYSHLPYDLESFRADSNSFSQYKINDESYKLYLSPRLGIAHPITTTSKIFFNYGHFYQPPVTDQLYTVRPSGSGAELPNINADWPRTVSYEIGFEQSVANDFLIHFMGYYKDVSDQLTRQTIVPFDNESVVTTWANNSYADIRGLEFKIERRVGRFWYGWVQLDYSIRSTGRTGYRYLYEDRQLSEQQSEQPLQTRNWPVPSVFSNMTFRTPQDFGPSLVGIKFLGNWQLNILQEWSDGGKQNLTPQSAPSEQHWADVIDYWNTDIRVEKRFQFNRTRFSVYMQVKNLFNYKGFPNPLYWNRYVDSLHFPWETGDQKGNDKLGDYKQDYIDLGWNTWSQFVNPRDIFFGIRIQM
ncbi:MAG: TonB-dependent receptor [Candidatus Marinimicrobia bacterium]|nr:TonB-dependent receptor [Candidatus Neomarinimicrobiota bacterium]MCF7830220.1 TonB-dependent receptor [Candidatus Neomarinimicrobiota bacterium]MCF7880837.1 TonB-dependent receptor [Candidatus Neomarinimicrobiota bacterium]